MNEVRKYLILDLRRSMDLETHTIIRHPPKSEYIFIHYSLNCLNYQL